MTIVVDYSYRNFKSEARTLDPGNLGYHADSGWTITGTIMDDYYRWVADFTAFHSIYGKLEGNFEKEVIAESQEALDNFLQYHHYNTWDYYDI